MPTTIAMRPTSVPLPGRRMATAAFDAFDAFVGLEPAPLDVPLRELVVVVVGRGVCRDTVAISQENGRQRESD